MESRRQGGHHGLCTVPFLGFGRRDVAEGLEEAAVVEPVHPCQGGELDGRQAAPRATAAHAPGLEQADDALC